MSGIELTGMDELDVKIKKVLEGFPERRKHLHEEVGGILLGEVKERTPYDTNRKKGTHLRDAIYMKVGSGGGYVAVRPDSKKAPHAHLVEEGHVQTDKDGNESFVKGKHMIEQGAAAVKNRLLNEAERFIDQTMEELK